MPRSRMKGIWLSLTPSLPLLSVNPLSHQALCALLSQCFPDSLLSTPVAFVQCQLWFPLYVTSLPISYCSCSPPRHFSLPPTIREAVQSCVKSQPKRGWHDLAFTNSNPALPTSREFHAEKFGMMITRHIAKKTSHLKQSLKWKTLFLNC